MRGVVGFASGGVASLNRPAYRFDASGIATVAAEPSFAATLATITMGVSSDWAKAMRMSFN